MSIDCTTVQDVGEQFNSSRYTRTNLLVFARVLGANALPSLRRTTTMFPAPKGEGVMSVLEDVVVAVAVGDRLPELDVDLERLGDAVYEGEPDEDLEIVPLALTDVHADDVLDARIDRVPDADPEPDLETETVTDDVPDVDGDRLTSGLTDDDAERLEHAEDEELPELEREALVVAETDACAVAERVLVVDGVCEGVCDGVCVDVRVVVVVVDGVWVDVCVGVLEDVDVPVPVPEGVFDGVSVFEGDGVIDGVPVPDGDGAGPLVEGTRGARAMPRNSARGVKKPTSMSLLPEFDQAGVPARDPSTYTPTRVETKRLALAASSVTPMTARSPPPAGVYVVLTQEPVVLTPRTTPTPKLAT
jgi:hypothetical protein